MINEGYTIDSQGIIVSPGKFEGEQRYSLYFYDLYMNGSWDDEDEDGVLSFNLDEQDWNRYPELRDTKTVFLYEDNYGFVYCGKGNDGNSRS